MIVEKHGVFVDPSFATEDIEVFIGYGEDAWESQETFLRNTGSYWEQSLPKKPRPYTIGAAPAGPQIRN